MKVTFYLKRPKSELTTVYARIYYSGIETKYYIPESNIEPRHWNPRTKEARKTLATYGSFNNNLKQYADTITDAINNFKAGNNGRPPTPNELKKVLDKEIRQKDAPQKMSLIQYFNAFIAQSESGTRLNERNGKPIGSGTIKTYKTTLVCIQEFMTWNSQPRLDFQDITQVFIKRFKSYCTQKEYTPNYIGKHIKTIKTVMGEAVADKQTDNRDFENFKGINEDVFSIYLSEPEITEIQGLDLSHNKNMERVRDLFIVGCYTGLRFSDISALSKMQINGEYMTITQTKTKDPVTIPLHPIVLELLNKYGGAFPKALSNQKTNAHLKDIGKEAKQQLRFENITTTKGGKSATTLVPRYKMISTHTARRSFATNEYLAGTDTITIRAITGHKTEAAFLKYIKVTRGESAVNLNNLWKNRQTAKELTQTTAAK